MADIEALHKFLRCEFQAEACTDFARLRRVPDTHVRHFLDYYRGLTTYEQNSLADASTLWGALRLWGLRPSTHYDMLKTNVAWNRWRHEMAMGGFRYHSVPMLRTCLAQAKIDRAKGKPSSVPKDLEEYAASVRSVKAPELRNLVRTVLKASLGARPSKLGGGDWDYDGSVNGSRVIVGIDYGGRCAQLRYEVAVQSTVPPVSFERAGFEVALGAGVGDWDFIVEENVSDSMKLLGEVVTYVAELPQRLPEGCLDQPTA
jgi:hypothetical protein